MLKWTWRSGLASDWNIWEDELTVADMDAEHRFVPYVKEVQSLQNIYSLSEVKNADVLVGMDFSALLMLKSVKHRPVKQKWILLAPIIDFCHGEDAWPQKQVLQVAKGVRKMPKVALQDVLNLFGPADEEYYESWMRTALQMDPELIAQGFEYLANEKVDSPLALLNCEVRFGKEDEWITGAVVEAAKNLLQGAQVSVRPKVGHWPMSLID